MSPTKASRFIAYTFVIFICFVSVSYSFVISDYTPQLPPSQRQKRIFCNPSGCGNRQSGKRDDGVHRPIYHMFNRLSKRNENSDEFEDSLGQLVGYNQRNRLDNGQGTENLFLDYVIHQQLNILQNLTEYLHGNPPQMSNDLTEVHELPDDLALPQQASRNENDSTRQRLLRYVLNSNLRKRSLL